MNILLSNEDEDLRNEHWYVNTNGYIRHVHTKKYLHKIIAERIGLDGIPDHKDRNKHNCRRDNFRSATKSQNGGNSISTRSSSGYRGVHWDSSIGYYRVQIKHKGKTHYIGVCKDPAIGHVSYIKKSKELFGEFSPY